MSRWLKHLLFISAVVRVIPVFGMDEIRLLPGESSSDKRHVYPHRILKLALDATVDSHGDYNLIYASAYMTRNRVLIEMQMGEKVNVHEAPTRAEWEQKSIPIRIPVRKGLLGYRLFLINDETQAAMTKLSTLDELKALYAGLGEQWSTTKVMQAHGFNIVSGNNYEGLFEMLSRKRFDYFPRGINEIFREYEGRRSRFPKMRIEQTKALFFPTPTYFFVSPAYPKLAERIEAGMVEIVEKGVLDREFEKEFGVDIKAANLAQRQVFRIENTQLTKETPLQVKSYWFDPSAH